MMEKAVISQTPRDNMVNTRSVQGFPVRTLRDFYFVIFRQKRKIILFFCAAFLATTLWTYLAPKTYQSDAKLLVRLGRESVTLDPTAATGQMINLSQSRENELGSELEILNSRALTEQVVDAIGYQAFLRGFGNPDEYFRSGSSQGAGETRPVGKDFLAEKTLSPDQLEDRDKAIGSLTKNLEMNCPKNSNIITISYKGPSQKLSQLVVAKLIDFYFDKHISVHRTAGSDEFFSRQTEELRTKLAQTEKGLRDMKNQTGIASVPEQRTNLINRIGNLQRSLEETEAAFAAAGAKMKAMQSTLACLPDTLLRTKITGYTGNPTDYLQQRLHDLQLKEQDLLSKYTDKTQLVQEARRQIDETQALLKKEGATHGQVTQLALLAEKAALSELHAKGRALKGELAEARSELRNLNNDEIRLAQLQREAEIQTANYRSYADKLEQARIERALEMGRISNISVIQPATFPVQPIGQRKTANLALGIFLGVFGGLGIAFMAEHFDRSFRTPQHVEKILHLPVLATPLLDRTSLVSVPKGENPIPIHTIQIIQGSFAGENGVQAIINQALPSAADSKQTGTLLAVTSCHTGEGVSSIAAAIGISLANYTEGRILLVDANLKQPSIHNIFGVSRSPGLTEIFDKVHIESLSFKPSFIKNLDLLTSGNGETNLGLFFNTKSFAALLDLWRREYSFVICDTPPIQEVFADLGLLKLVDGVIFVVEAERTRWEVAQNAKGILAQAKVDILTVVLNKRQFPIPAWLYRTL